MKSLKESLFDKDIENKELYQQRLLKTFKKKLSKSDLEDIMLFIDEQDDSNPPFSYADIISNPDINKWMLDFSEKYKNLPCGLKGEDPCNSSAPREEIFDWLKIGKIHKGCCWNDRMYANAMDISWDDWGTDSQVNNIIEWLMFNKKYQLYILINRKEYDKADQQLLHELISNFEKHQYKL